MKVLLLKCYSTNHAWGQRTIDSFKLHIARVPSAQIDICDACAGQTLPALDQYDLVILTGGPFNLLNTSFEEYPAWVQHVLSQIQELAIAPKMTKFLGLCWGHQAVQVAQGGTLTPLREGPRIGVESIELTPAGEDMFGVKFLRLLKFHKRHITSPAAGFTPLAANNEILISDSKKILTFQGHPEMTRQIAQDLIDSDDGTYRVVPGNTNSSLDSIETAHDCELVWEKIMNWAQS